MAENGYKTENRKKILEYLVNHPDTTVSVKEIHTYMQEHQSAVNLTTIYRYLDKLEKEGKVIRYVSEKGDKTTYQYVSCDSHCDEHLHLKCLKCGKIIHLDCQFMSEIAEHISSHHKFDIQCKNSIIYGICDDCRSKK